MQRYIGPYPPQKLLSIIPQAKLCIISFWKRCRLDSRWEKRENKTMQHFRAASPIFALSAVSPVSIFFMFLVIFLIVWVLFWGGMSVWVCKMGLLCKIPQTPIWIIPCEHCINVPLVERCTTASLTVPAMWRSLASTEQINALRPLMSSAVSASPGKPTWQHGVGSWGSRGKLRRVGGRQTVANSLDCRTKLPAVGGLGHVTSSAETQLSAALQATADSLYFAWLKHGLVPNSLSAHPCQEHE